MGTILAVALAAGLAGQNIYASDAASGSVETTLQTDAGSQNSSAFGNEGASSNEGTDDTDDSNAQISYPAVSLETTLDDGTVIHVDAPEGAFPEGIQMTVTAVDPAEILDALRTASGDSDLTESDVCAFDFDFWMSAQSVSAASQDSATVSDTAERADAGGEIHNIEPEVDITVSIQIPEMSDTDSVSAYHLDSTDSAAEPERVLTQSECGTAVITSGSFSIHAVVMQAAAVTAATTGITIDYDENTTIHSVTDTAGDKIILYCMNDKLHWPHSTPTTPNVPKYTEETIEQFFTDNGITETTQQTVISQTLLKLLYAGYPYNGFGLYEVVDQAMTLTEAEFNQFLDPPAYLRTDFPDSVGNNTFTYSDRTDASKISFLKKFLQEAYDLYSGGTTQSGLTYSQL